MKRRKHAGLKKFSAIILSLILCVTMAPMGVWAEGESGGSDAPDFANAVQAKTNLNVIEDASASSGYKDQELVTVDPEIAYPAFRNVNDGTNEGLRYKRKKIFTVQFHPEACGGPLDSGFLFDRFIEEILR